jgi:hypothetical protein
MTHLQRLEYQRKYNQAHKEQRKAYYEKNREKYNAYNRKYYRENKNLWEEFYSPRAIVKAARKEEAE